MTLTDVKPFNPVRRAENIEKTVMKEEERKYYRFRYSRYYGGIVTADTVGCNLLCAYCWNYFKNLRPEKQGRFYPPEEVAENLVRISRKKNTSLFRISGAEPVLGRKSMEHLGRVIGLVGSEFILETNGVMLGYMPELADSLEGLDVAVRITMKGWDEKSFEMITGAEGKYFRYQIAALEELTERKITAWPAVMYDVFKEGGVAELREKLGMMGVERVELEYLERYRFVMENLRKRGIGV